MDNPSLQIKTVCLVSILAGVLSAMIPKGRMKSAYASMSAVVLLSSMIIPLKSLGNMDFSAISIKHEEVSDNLEKESKRAETELFEAVVSSSLSDYFSEKGIRTIIKVESELFGDELSVEKINVSGSFNDEEKEYVTGYLTSCFENVTVYFTEGENG